MDDPCLSSISTEEHTGLNGLVIEFTLKCPCLLCFLPSELKKKN